MIDRIFKSWKTSLIGLGVLVFGFAMVWTEKATILEASPFISGIFAILWKEKK